MLIVTLAWVGLWGVQWFDHAKGRWQWDLAKVEAMDYTDNVVEFMAQDLRNLPHQVHP